MTTPVASLNPDSLLIAPLDSRLLEEGQRDSRLVAQALDRAIFWHRNQERKYTKEPYVNHPIDVVNALNFMWHQTFGTNAPGYMVAAGLLHDVVEDCGVTYQQIKDMFGVHVCALVFWLTDDIPNSMGNRDTRKALARSKLASAPAAAKILKHYDCESNERSIREHDPEHYRKTIRNELVLLEDAMGTNTANGLLRLLYKVRTDPQFVL